MTESHTDIAVIIVHWIELAAFGIELVAVLIIIGTVVGAGLKYLMTRFARSPVPEAYGDFKIHLGRALQLGLEVLIAADIIRTVTLDLTRESVSTLGLLVLVRTFLSWSLVVEIEGRWPWQSRAETKRSSSLSS